MEFRPLQDHGSEDAVDAGTGVKREVAFGILEVRFVDFEMLVENGCNGKTGSCNGTPLF